MEIRTPHLQPCFRALKPYDCIVSTRIAPIFACAVGMYALL